MPHYSGCLKETIRDYAIVLYLVLYCGFGFVTGSLLDEKPRDLAVFPPSVSLL